MFFRVERGMIRSESGATARDGRLKEAFEMFDSFSEGTVFYGRAAAMAAAMLAIAILVHLI